MIIDLLKKYGVDFIAAPLGNSSNKEAFIESDFIIISTPTNYDDINNKFDTKKDIFDIINMLDDVEIDIVLEDYGLKTFIE